LWYGWGVFGGWLGQWWLLVGFEFWAWWLLGVMAGVLGVMAIVLFFCYTGGGG